MQEEKKQGFPWRYSAHFVPSLIEEQPENKSAIINGRYISGKIKIFRDCEIKEVSFTATPVDEYTQCVVLSEFFNQNSTGGANMEKQIEALQAKIAELSQINADLEKKLSELQEQNSKLETKLKEEGLELELASRNIKISDKMKNIFLALPQEDLHFLLDNFNQIEGQQMSAGGITLSADLINLEKTRTQKNPLLQVVEDRAK